MNKPNGPRIICEVSLVPAKHAIYVLCNAELKNWPNLSLPPSPFLTYPYKEKGMLQRTPP